MSSTFEKTDVGTVPADATPCVPRGRHQACGARHEFGVRPTAGSPSPCHGREGKSVDPEVDAGRSAFRTSGPSAAEPVAMPPDDGVRLDDHQRRAPVLPDSRQGDPKTVNRHVRGAGASRNVSSPSVAAEAPGSPGPFPDGRGAPTPVHARRRGVAPACIDRGWRRCEKSTGTSSGESQHELEVQPARCWGVGRPGSTGEGRTKTRNRRLSLRHRQDQNCKEGQLYQADDHA